ncbi:MAG: hypothetical protein WDZ28_01215 [Simkaniaceae bacterium]
MCLVATFSLWSHIDFPSSEPFISGDTFKKHSDFSLDQCSDFDPLDVQYGDIIFVNAAFLSDFFEKKHPFIREGYVLITHEHVRSVPGKFASYLDDPHLLAWFGKNAFDVAHPKLFCIPLGLTSQRAKNGRWRAHGKIEVLKKCIERGPSIGKKHLLYQNYSLNTHPSRKKTFKQIEKMSLPFLFQRKKRVNYEQYLLDTLKSDFVISPRGRSMDCHRIWEALYLGTIPIVKHSPLDCLLKDLPILFVDDWSEISQEFLERKKKEILSKKYNLEKIYFSYWKQKINEYKLPSLIRQET